MFFYLCSNFITEITQYFGLGYYLVPIDVDSSFVCFGYECDVQQLCKFCQENLLFIFSRIIHCQEVNESSLIDCNTLHNIFIKLIFQPTGRLRNNCRDND